MLEDAQTRECKQILRKHNLNPIKRLGKGGFGVVYLVSKTDFNTYETQLFSVKCTSKRTFVKKPVLRRYLKQEITLLENLDHSNIVKLHRTFEDSGWIFMLMEYCNLGNLATNQSLKAGKVYHLLQATQIILSVIEGLCHMHSKSIIHRDIKPENILLTKCEKEEVTVVKICDLGFARETQENAETFCGTTYYMAPEIHCKQKYDHKVDVWAVGVLLFNMLFGTHPFKSLNMVAEIQSKCEKGFDLKNAKMNKNQSVSHQHFQELTLIFSKVFELNPQKRISLLDFKNSIYSLQSTIKNSPKSSQKATIESDDASEDEMPEFYIQQIQFIQQVKNEVSELKFLNNIEELALKYYLDKVCLSIFLSNDDNNRNNGEISKHLPMNLINQIKNNQNVDTVFLASNLSKLNIKKFSQVFTSNASTNFQNYKQAYRLVVGHAFYKAHKKIEDEKLKNQIKLKLFCCHVINRVFEKAHVPELFKYYYEWLCDQKRQLVFSLPVFMQWVRAEKPQNIIETVQMINNRFYKRNK